MENKDVVIAVEANGSKVLAALRFQKFLIRKLRSLPTTGSVEFDRHRLLIVYDSCSGLPSTGVPSTGEPCAAFVPRVQFVMDAEKLPIVEETTDYSAEDLVQDVIRKIASIIIDNVHRKWCQLAKSRQRRASNEAIISLRQLLRSVLKFKPHRTPLLLSPRSIHPIELSA